MSLGSRDRRKEFSKWKIYRTGEITFRIQHRGAMTRERICCGLYLQEWLLTTLASVRLTRICVPTAGSVWKTSVLLTGRHLAW
jgi:hypothetical protein